MLFLVVKFFKFFVLEFKFIKVEFFFELIGYIVWVNFFILKELGVLLVYGRFFFSILLYFLIEVNIFL